MFHWAWYKRRFVYSTVGYFVGTYSTVRLVCRFLAPRLAPIRYIYSACKRAFPGPRNLKPQPPRPVANLTLHLHHLTWTSSHTSALCARGTYAQSVTAVVSEWVDSAIPSPITKIDFSVVYCQEPLRALAELKTISSRMQIH
jgi:hypothetical protein